MKQWTKKNFGLTSSLDVRERVDDWNVILLYPPVLLVLRLPLRC